jgi:LuxR family transcriptional regulator, maltose regulon positive regulatory protein
LSRGNLAEAAAVERRRANNANQSASSAAGATQIVDGLISASLLHKRARSDEALRLLAGLREVVEEAGRTDSLMEILTLQALALWASREKARAVSTLTQALALAEPEGYVCTFVDEGTAMGDLLAEVFNTRQRSRRNAPIIPARYFAKLLTALGQDAAAPAAAADGRLPETLSERELEVLALIAAGRSNQEIAGKLFVSTSTVKTHINNLYRKLAARSRIQAVASAREMGLL